MKKAILYFSDCPFFAGCENMIANFLSSEKLKNEFDVTLAYRNTESYESGLFSRSNLKEVQLIAMDLPIQAYSLGSNFTIPVLRYLHVVIQKLLNVPRKYYTIFLAIFPLYNLLKKGKYDLIHVNNGGYPAAFTTYSLIIAARLLGIKNIVYVVNNLAKGYEKPSRWLDYPLDYLVRKNVKKFITGSKFASHRLKEVLGLTSGQLTQIPNGIFPRAVKLDRVTYLKSIGIESDPNVLVFSVIALMEERKGHIWLLKAISELVENYSEKVENLFFVFEGQGPEQRTIEKYIAKQNLGGKVILIGKAPRVFELINSSDVIILPSIDHEDFPNIIIEAMSMCKPTIGTKIAGIPEQINDNDNGYLVSAKDPVGLANAILRLCDLNVRKKFSLNAKKKFNQNYTVSISIERYVNMYKSILDFK